MKTIITGVVSAYDSQPEGLHVGRIYNGKTIIDRIELEYEEYPLFANKDRVLRYVGYDNDGNKLFSFAFGNMTNVFYKTTTP